VKVSVVIPAHNAGPYLGEQLAALASQEIPEVCADSWEIVVVDHASTDDTAQIARSWTGRIPVRVVEAAAGGGAGFVRNTGASASTGELLLFCDADDVVAPRWVAAMVDALEEYDLVGGSVEHGCLNDPAVVAWRTHDHVDGLPLGLRFLPIASGSNMGVRRDVFEGAGAFDPHLVAVEDKDFCFRLVLAGHSIGFAPNARVAYRHRDSLRGLWRQQWVYGKGDVQLYALYRERGMPSPNVGAALRSWFGLLARLPLLVDRTRRGQWVRIAATRLSRLVESARLRAWYP
jgi:glycosyltransferase involved in cell wall biosynthesis